MKRLKKNNLGFTLIEMIVSLGLFSFVITTAVGAMLVLVGTNRQLQAQQSVMTNLSFALDVMTREIRTGYNYYCDESSNNEGNNNIFNDNNDPDDIIGTKTQDCPGGRSHSEGQGNSDNRDFQGVSFFEGGNSITGSTGDKRIMYYFDQTDSTIKRRVGNEDAQSIVSSGLSIEDANFYVSGSNKLTNNIDSSDNGNIEQPTVTIYIKAKEKDDTSGKYYYLQTTVTQRALDI